MPRAGQSSGPLLGDLLAQPQQLGALGTVEGLITLGGGRLDPAAIVRPESITRWDASTLRSVLNDFVGT